VIALRAGRGKEGVVMKWEAPPEREGTPSTLSGKWSPLIAREKNLSKRGKEFSWGGRWAQVVLGRGRPLSVNELA